MKKINLIQSGGTIAMDHRNKTPELGVVSAGDMTVEASVSKTMHLMGKEVAGNEFKTQFEQNLAGERTD